MAVKAGTAYVDVRPNLEGFQSSVASGTKSAFSKLSSLAKLAIGGVIVKQVADFALSTVHAAEDAAAANRKSFGLIKKDADGAAINFRELKGWAEKFGDAIGQDDEAISTLASKIAASFDLKSLFKDPQAGLETLTKSILDFSAATGKSQSLATKLFQSIANDPKTAVSTLTKLGVITKGQADFYKHMADNGRAAEVTTKLLADVQAKYAGAAKAAATPSEKLAAVWDNFKEVIGGFLLPLFTKVTSALIELIHWVSGLFDAFSSGQASLGNVGGFFTTVVDAAKGMVAFFKKDVLAVWHALVDVYHKNLQPALTSLGSAFKKLEPILQFLFKTWVTIQKVILDIALKALPVIIRVIGVLIQVIAKVIDVVSSLVVWIADKLTKAFNVAKGVFNVFKIALIAGWNAIKAIGSGIWDAILGAAKTVFNAIAIAWNSTVGKLGFHFHHFGLNIDVDVPDIPTFATGGIVMQPTLGLLGERGPEAVVPLGGRGMTLRILDWRTGMAQLSSELDWADRSVQSPA